MKTKILNEKLKKFIGSRTFFVLIMTAFIIQASWLAISARSLPFDEYFHVGVIKLYSEQWSPVISEQPFEASLFGDVTRLPSYLYHFAMSFPYRLISLFTGSLVVQTIILRFINIGFAVGAILLFRRLFREAGISNGHINIATLLFTSTPIVVLLTAHINYDNLILLLTSLLFTYAYRIYTRPLNITDLSLFMAIGLFSSLIKHLSLALFGLLFVFLAVHLVRRRKSLAKWLKSSLGRTSKPALFGCAALLIVGGGLFVERHVQNTIRYGSPDVKCEAVQPSYVCSMYSPWRRNQKIASQNLIAENSDPVSFTAFEWLPRITKGSHDIFTNIPRDVPITEDPYGFYVGKQNVWLHPRIGQVMMGVGAFLIIFKLRFLFRNKLSQTFLVTSSLLTLSVWLYNYKTYLKYGMPLAVQFRYLIPVFLPMLLLTVQAANVAAGRKLQSQKAVIAALVLIAYCYGGGATGWLIRADSDWYFQSDSIRGFNQRLQSIAKRVIVH